MKIGIDKIGFYTSDLYIEMAELAKQRNEDPDKYLIGIGQQKMAVIRASQDAITLAANAADQILTAADKSQLGLVIFATESGVDNSKSAATSLAKLLGLPAELRAIELKQACFGATAGLELAYGFLLTHPQQKALVIGSDIARYGLRTPGEPTQGGGAIAMLVAADPQILVLNNDNAAVMQDAFDFWRPIGQTQALVAGKYSTQLYLQLLAKVWQLYQQQTGHGLTDFAAVLFHLPYTKLGLKGLRSLVQESNPLHAAKLLRQFEVARYYNSQVGNLYTGSLYLSLLSLLKNSQTLKTGQQIGFYSYGSGAQAEFFSGSLQSGFSKQLAKSKTTEFLAGRKKISIAEYEQIYCNQELAPENAVVDFTADPAKFVLAGIRDFKRQYLCRSNENNS